MSKKKNFFDWSKGENEKTYTDGFCRHKDRIFTIGEEHCRSCGTTWSWDGKSYNTNRRPVKLEQQPSNKFKESEK